MSRTGLLRTRCSVPGKTGTSYYFLSSASVSNLVKYNHLDNTCCTGSFWRTAKRCISLVMCVIQKKSTGRFLERLKTAFEGGEDVEQG